MQPYILPLGGWEKQNLLTYMIVYKLLTPGLCFDLHSRVWECLCGSADSIDMTMLIAFHVY